MPSLVIANCFSIVVLLIVILGILSKHNRTRSSMALLWVCVACIICDTADALSYSIAGPLLPDFLTMAIYIASYTFGNILLIFFTNYWYTYINDKHPISKIFAIVPISLLIFIFIISLFYFISGRVVKIENGVTTFVGSTPIFINIIQVIVLTYFPVVAIIERKYIGIKAVSFLGAAGLVPLFTIFLAIKLHIPDYSYPASSLAMLIAYILLDTQLTQEKDEEYQYQLVERNLELEKINAELEVSKKNAECANKAKTMFLNNMSHDIRTPMNAILGFTGLVESNLDNKEVVLDYIGKIKTSGDYLLNIINNVLDISRIDSGKIVLDEDPNDLLSPDNTVIPMVAVQMKEKNLKLEMFTDIKHRYVYVDMMKTKQIVLNLLSNAVKYTPEGGTMNGIDATKKIRKFSEKSKAEIPIIAMTANVFEEDKKLFSESGMNGFVPKPIDVPVLLSEIKRVC